MRLRDKLIEREKRYYHTHGKRRYLVYRRTAGLGDLLLGLYSSWRYASLYDRDLVVDWRWSLFLKDDRNLFSYLFDNCRIRNVNINGGEEVSSIIYPEPFYPSFFTNDSIRKSKYHPYNFSPYGDKIQAEKQAWYILKGVYVSEPTYVVGEQLCIAPSPSLIRKWYEDVTFFFMALFSHLKPKLCDKISSSRKILMGDKNPVGVHVRDGNDDPIFLFDHIRGRPQANKEKDLRLLLSPLKDQDVYFCTDSAQIQEMAIAIRPSLISYKRWYAPMGIDPHFAIGNSGEDLICLTENIFTEMVLLSFCKKILSLWGKSCFSIFPSLINNFPSYEVIPL